MEVINKNMSKTFAAKDTTSLATEYKNWSASYDAENTVAGFRLPALGAALMARYVPAGDQRILDAGCGTGLAGDNLAVLGYKNLVGIDLSPAMLQYAEKRHIYTHLHKMELGKELDFPSNSFVAVISTGVFTEGHAPSSSFDELIRVTQVGGHLVFSVRDDIYEAHGFREKQEALEKEGHWQLLEQSERFRSFLTKEPDLFARLFVYRVN